MNAELTSSGRILPLRPLRWRWQFAYEAARIVRFGQLPLTVLLATRGKRSVSWFTTVVAAPLSLPEQAAAIAAMGDAR